jgi:hypothetical protein
MDNNTDETQYILSLTDKEKKGYEIAKSHLGSAFRLLLSNGFVTWHETEKKKNNPLHP